MESPLLSTHGAVPADELDLGIAAHYGAPSREQRRLADGDSFVDLSHRGVIRMTGPDRLKLLHALTTQDLEHLKPGTGTTTLVLSPQGRVEHALYGVDDGETFWAHVEPGATEGTVGFFESMKFTMDAETTDVTDEVALVWEPVSEGHGDLVSRHGRDSLGGREVFVPRRDLSTYAGDRSPAGIWAYEAFRIAAHHPRLGRETDHKAIPNELGWLDVAVHLDKGCYRGQETVGRIHNLGRPPRRLVMLHLDGSVDTLPGHCADVELDGKTVGFVGSSARHHELGPIALAVVKRNVPVDATLLAGGVAAAQEVVVDPDIGVHFKPRAAL